MAGRVEREANKRMVLRMRRRSRRHNLRSKRKKPKLLCSKRKRLW